MYRWSGTNINDNEAMNVIDETEEYIINKIKMYNFLYGRFVPDHLFIWKILFIASLSLIFVLIVTVYSPSDSEISLSSSTSKE